MELLGKARSNGFKGLASKEEVQQFFFQTMGMLLLEEDGKYFLEPLESVEVE